MKSFDFNSIQQPMMEITLPDKEHSQLHLTIPKTSLVERMVEMAEELEEIIEKKDENTLYKAYSLLAEIMSCNQECREFTAEELKGLLNVEHIAAFSLEYVTFLGELKREKN
jgi:hypothetical protein